MGAMEQPRVVNVLIVVAVVSLLGHWYISASSSNNAAAIQQLHATAATSGQPQAVPAWANALVGEMRRVSAEFKQLQATAARAAAGNGTSDDDDDASGLTPAQLQELRARQQTLEKEVEQVTSTIATLVEQTAAAKAADQEFRPKTQLMQHELLRLADLIAKLTNDLGASGEKHATLSASVSALTSSFNELQAALAAHTSSPSMSSADGPKPLPPTNELHQWHPGLKETHSEKIAIIIESRPIPRLLRAIRNFYEVIEPNWEFQVWFSPLNERMLRDSPFIQQAMRAGRLRMYPMGRERFDVPWYNQLMMRNASFWEFVGRGTSKNCKLLIFQVDAVACKKSPRKVEEFLHYDYIGAPWKDPWYGDAGGNGGLCIRGRDAMQACVAAFRGYGANEDGYFTECVRDAEVRGERKIAHREDAKTFSVETLFYPTPWGVHNAWTYLSKEETKQLQDYCPEMADPQRPLEAPDL